jgi:hypothetical protein
MEPFVRRYWSNSLITWNRLLSGRFGDVRVGRDVLVGWVAAAVLMATQFSVYHALVGQGASDPGASAFPMTVETLMGARFGMSTLLGSALAATTGRFYLLLTLFLFRLTLRNKWLAVVAFTILWTTLYCIDTDSIAVWLMSGLYFAGLAVVLTRFGLSAGIATRFFSQCLTNFPLTMELDAWYAPSGLFAVAVVLAIAAFGFYHAVGGRAYFAAGDSR